MNKIVLALLATAMLAACGNHRPEEMKLKQESRQEKNLLRNILDMHEKVMTADGDATENKMMIDSLLKIKKLNDADGSVAQLSHNIGAADDAMSDWMNKFQLDYKGKSHQDVINYYTAQKKQVTAIDSNLNALNGQADKLLAPYKKK